VVAVEDQEVVLEVAPGVNVRFLRRAIMDVIPDGSQDYSEPEAEEPEPAEPETYDETEDGAAKGG
jgi:preprotein translocase subunit YajC